VNYDTKILNVANELKFNTASAELAYHLSSSIMC